MHPFAKAALGAAAAAYANHSFVKPVQIAKIARMFANRVGKPMLTFVPPAGATLKSIFTPSLAIGDMNLHHTSKTRASGPGQIGYGNPHQVPVASRSFGCVFSCDTLEHLERPDVALMEWHRIADRVFVVVPPWWTPDAWLSKWYIESDIRRAWPVWTRQSRTIWLPSASPRAYAAKTCRTPSPQSPRSMQRPMGHSTTSSPSAESEMPGPASNESAPVQSPLPVVRLLQQVTQTEPEEPDYTPEEESSGSQSSEDSEPYLPPGSPSSTSVSSMMIVSGPDPESD